MVMASPGVKYSGDKIAPHSDLQAGAAVGGDITKRYCIGTYNARTLRTEDPIVELEELGKIRWDIIGLAEVRRKTKDA